MAEISLSEFQNRPKGSPKKQSPFAGKGSMLVGAALLVVVGFLAGMQYQKSNTKTASATNTASSQSSGYGGFGGAGGSGGYRRGRAFGTVTAVSSSSISVQGRSGTTSTYNITSSTTVTNNGQSASVSDIQNGDTVILTLDTSNTQNVTAIMLNPSFGGGPGGFGGSSASGSSSSTPAPDTSGPDSSGAGASGI